MKILFFIGSLRSGGKERRLLELISYLKKSNQIKIKLVLAYNEIDYPLFYNLNIDFTILHKKVNRKDIKIFFTLYKICKSFKPDIIHTWGSMQTFYMLPSAEILKIPLVNSQITNAPPELSKNLFLRFQNLINFKYSDIILSNSYAGLKSYGVESMLKAKVIYNGVNLYRFKNFTNKDIIKSKFGIKTPFSVVMVASFTKNKNYDLYVEVAEFITNKRNDITFICVGDGENFKQIAEKTKNNPLVLLTGKITNVEELVSACDVGVLFSPNGEGISNSIIEYMALGKPVIADDAGGTNELIIDNETGYLIRDETVSEIAKKLINLIDDNKRRYLFGEKGKEIIENKFTIDKMGQTFENLYKSLSFHKF